MGMIKNGNVFTGGYFQMTEEIFIICETWGRYEDITVNILFATRDLAIASAIVEAKNRMKTREDYECYHETRVLI